MSGLTIVAAEEDERRVWESAGRALPGAPASGKAWHRQTPTACGPRSGWERSGQAKTKNAGRGLAAFAAVLLAVGSISVGLTLTQNPAREVIARISDGEREQIRWIDIADCRNRVLAGQDSRLDASDSRDGRAELARHIDQVVQYCGCAFEAGSHLLTKDDVIKQWSAEGRAFKGALTARGRALLDQSVRTCAEEAGFRTDLL